MGLTERIQVTQRAGTTEVYYRRDAFVVTVGWLLLCGIFAGLLAAFVLAFLLSARDGRFVGAAVAFAFLLALVAWAVSVATAGTRLIIEDGVVRWRIGHALFGRSRQVPAAELVELAWKLSGSGTASGGSGSYARGAVVTRGGERFPLAVFRGSREGVPDMSVRLRAAAPSLRVQAFSQAHVFASWLPVDLPGLPRSNPPGESG